MCSYCRFCGSNCSMHAYGVFRVTCAQCNSAYECPSSCRQRCPSCHYCRNCSYNCGHCQMGTPVKSKPSGIDPAEAVFDMTERLFALPGKDVTFVLSDGEVEAHSLVLMAGSEVFQEMMKSEMLEGRTRRIELQENAATIRVFLRLLYTGHVDSSDWTTGSIGEDAVPLDIIVGVAVLVKKYMVEPLVDLTTQTVISRLNSLLQDESKVGSWEEAMSAVLRHDLAPVRTACLEEAKSNEFLRRRYHEKQLKPEVQYELSAFWGTPTSRRSRSRFL